MTVITKDSWIYSNMCNCMHIASRFKLAIRTYIKCHIH